eukprot:s2591_g5.t1
MDLYLVDGFLDIASHSSCGPGLDKSMADVDEQEDDDDKMDPVRPVRSKSKNQPSWYRKEAADEFFEQLRRKRRDFKRSIQKRAQEQEQDVVTATPSISSISSMVRKAFSG